MIRSKTGPALLQKSYDPAIDPHTMETPTQKNDAPAFFAQATRKRFTMQCGMGRGNVSRRSEEVDAVSFVHAAAQRELSPRNRAG